MVYIVVHIYVIEIEDVKIAMGPFFSFLFSLFVLGLVHLLKKKMNDARTYKNLGLVICMFWACNGEQKLSTFKRKNKSFQSFQRAITRTFNFQNKKTKAFNF
jgi:hypothetical protein